MDINTIVVGYDGSDCSQRAVDAAVSVMEDGGTVHIVSAYDAPSARQINEAYSAVPTEFTSSIDLMSGPRGILEQLAGQLAEQGHVVVDHFIDDDPASAIMKVAEDVGADLIVVGSRGLGRAAQVIRGSVSTKIAHHASVDFMVVH